MKRKRIIQALIALFVLAISIGAMIYGTTWALDKREAKVEAALEELDGNIIVPPIAETIVIPALPTPAVPPLMQLPSQEVEPDTTYSIIGKAEETQDVAPAVPSVAPSVAKPKPVARRKPSPAPQAVAEPEKKVPFAKWKKKRNQNKGVPILKRFFGPKGK